jgi:cytochrome c
MEGYLFEIALDEVKHLVDEAIGFYRITGKEIALAEFSNPQGRFVEGQQYVYVLDSNGTMIAHGGNEKYVGEDFYRVQDSDGKSFIKEIVDTANVRGFGWVEYQWLDLATKTEQSKTTYFEKVDNLIFCSGVCGRRAVFSSIAPTSEEAALYGVSADTISEESKPEVGGLIKESVQEDVVELAREDAKRWVEKAIVFYRANGRGIALAEFTSPRGRFVRGEQYVYVLDINGMMLAHPVNDKYVGKDFYHIQDSDGKRFIQKIVDTANTADSCWVEYKWFNPATKMVLPKAVYCQKVDNMIFCSGVYES